MDCELVSCIGIENLHNILRSTNSFIALLFSVCISLVSAYLVGFCGCINAKHLLCHGKIS